MSSFQVHAFSQAMYYSATGIVAFRIPLSGWPELALSHSPDIKREVTHPLSTHRKLLHI